MLRIDTRRIVAMMADVNAFWKRAILPLVGESVCSAAFPIRSFAKPKSSIAASGSASPNPTWAKFRTMDRDWAVLVNLRPKVCGGHRERV